LREREERKERKERDNRINQREFEKENENKKDKKVFFPQPWPQYAIQRDSPFWPTSSPQKSTMGVSHYPAGLCSVPELLLPRSYYFAVSRESFFVGENQNNVYEAKSISTAEGKMSFL
jgi:hypothetical protein